MPAGKYGKTNTVPSSWLLPATRAARRLTRPAASSLSGSCAISHPSTLGLTHKVQDYALNITDSAHLRVANMTLLGTTLRAEGGVPGLRLESLQFRFPSFSRRMLGSAHTPATTKTTTKKRNGQRQFFLASGLPP